MRYQVTYGDNLVGEYETEHEAWNAFDALPFDDVAKLWDGEFCLDERQSHDANLNWRRA